MALNLKKPKNKLEEIQQFPKADPVQVIAHDPDEPQIDFRIVDVSLIHPNPWNPNDMEAEFFEAIVSQVKAEGMIQPVLVFPHPEKEGEFMIADGEHRWKASKLAGIKKIGVIVVPYNPTQARLKTVSMNNLRGQNIPIKLARLLVDLHKEYTPAQIRSLTGIGEDEQQSVLSLLKVPDFNPSDGVKMTAQEVDRPISVSLMLMPDENTAYTTAMKKAMKLMGDDVTALIGHEVASYDQAMKASMGIAGAKLRNVALAVICETFNSLPKDMQDAVAAKAHAKIYDKLAHDAEVKEDKKAKTDKKV